MHHAYSWSVRKKIFLQENTWRKGYEEKCEQKKRGKEEALRCNRCLTRINKATINLEQMKKEK